MAAKKTWGESWETDSYGEHGFYRHHQPADHFSTAVQSGSIAIALAEFLQLLLAQHSEFTVVDVGAGQGELLTQLHSLIPQQRMKKVRLIALELRARPDYLPDHIEWWQGDARTTCHDLPPSAGLLIAHEFLDDLPCELVEFDEQVQAHVVMHEDSDDSQWLGESLEGARYTKERVWLDQWWPTKRPFMRVEIGSERDTAWHGLTQWLTSGYAIAIDYAHVQEERDRGLWDGGTVVGYLNGRAVPARLGVEMNLTAHVALESLAAAATGSPTSRMVRRGPTPDFWWLIQTYGDADELTWPDRIRK